MFVYRLIKGKYNGLKPLLRCYDCYCIPRQLHSSFVLPLH
nr:MAG TPA: hypothetical protein [Crassvirales sp.]